MRNIVHKMPIPTIATHHFQSQSQRGPFGMVFASRSSILISLALYVATGG